MDWWCNSYCKYDIVFLFHIDSQRLGGCILDGGCSSTDSPIITPTPTDYLIVKEESDCVKLENHSWSSIIIGKGVCNELSSALIISSYTNLVRFEIRRDSLNNVPSIEISSNPLLQEIKLSGSFDNVYSVEISSRNSIHSLLIDLPVLSSLIIAEDSFDNANVLSLNSSNTK